MHRRRFLQAAAGGAAGALWPSKAAASQPAPDPKRIYVVFKTHLDVGYTDYAERVVARYFDHFIPSAIALAQQLGEESPETGLVWTTGAWLIYEYLECATPAQRRLMERAIDAGHVAWHAIPLTFHSELVEQEHFRYGLSLSRRLDKRFGRTTIATKMTDVPGHTRAIVPLLHEAGIRFLHIGVNPASSAPEVPDLFRWCDARSGAEVITAYTKGGYGNLVACEGCDAALFIAMTNDNHGPQTVEAVKALYKRLKQQYPNAALVPGRLDDFARGLAQQQATLPRITQELGDTWIHGAACDPKTTVPYRQLCRLRNAWLQRDLTDAHRQALDRFSRRLLLVPEHTWGLSELGFLNDYEHWTKDSFQAVRGREDYRTIEHAWTDKRRINAEAVAELEGTPLAQEAREALETMAPKRPDLANYVRVEPPGQPRQAGPFTFQFGAAGALEHLETADGRNWAGPAHPLGAFWYEVFSLEQFQAFYRAYTILDVDWSRSDLGKVCLDRAAPHYAKAVPRAQTWRPKLEALYTRETPQGHAYLAALAAPEEACERFGCPRKLFAEYVFENDKPLVHIDFQFFNKDASRIGESLWLTFRPVVQHPEQWTLFKMGRPVSPLDVAPGGNQYLHAVDPGVVYRAEDGLLEIDAPDAALCAPGEAALLRFDNAPPKPAQGVHFNLYNNVWGTNFRSWYGEDARFRFTLRAISPQHRRVRGEYRRGG